MAASPLFDIVRSELSDAVTPMLTGSAKRRSKKSAMSKNCPITRGPWPDAGSRGRLNTSYQIRTR